MDTDGSRSWEVNRVTSRIARKLVVALVVALVAELTDLVMDKVGVSEDRSQLARALLKSSIVAASGVFLAGIVSKHEQEEAAVSAEASSLERA